MLLILKALPQHVLSLNWRLASETLLGPALDKYQTHILITWQQRCAHNENESVHYPPHELVVEVRKQVLLCSAHAHRFKLNNCQLRVSQPQKMFVILLDSTIISRRPV